MYFFEHITIFLGQILQLNLNKDKWSFGFVNTRFDLKPKVSHNNHLIACFYTNKKNVFEYEIGDGLVRIGMRDI